MPKLGYSVFAFEFLNGCLASEARQAGGISLWVSMGGRCGDVGKLGVLQACPYLHADPLLIHQAEPRCLGVRLHF